MDYGTTQGHLMTHTKKVSYSTEQYWALSSISVNSENIRIYYIVATVDYIFSSGLFYKLVNFQYWVQTALTHVIVL
jgi:hypothetical protein